MVSEWKTYRTRFLIQAKQLDAPLTFVDCIGREHSGQKGDYLVLSSDGSKRIAPREIFEDIYVPMTEHADPWPTSAQISTSERDQLSTDAPASQSTQPRMPNPQPPPSPPSPQLHSQPTTRTRRSAGQVWLA